MWWREDTADGMVGQPGSCSSLFSSLRAQAWHTVHGCSSEPALNGYSGENWELCPGKAINIV